MGRCYNGDINGKFWFGIQSSNAADQFGAIGTIPNYLRYYFCKDDLEEVEEQVKKIEDTLGAYKTTFDNFFKEMNSYNDNTLKKYGILDAWNKHKNSYVDLLLGIKIKDCIKKHGECAFDAER